MNTPPLKYCLGFTVLTALFSVIFLTVSSFANPLPPIVVVRWETDLNVATIRAEREQRPLFLHFVGNDNPAAVQAGNEVFTHPNIAAHLNANYVMVRINATENPALAQRFNITAVPTDLILKPNGTVINQRVGVIPADKFAGYLMFLQDKMQSEKPQVSAPTTAMPGAFPIVNPQNSMQSVPPPNVASPITQSPQHDISSVARDPFAPQTPAVQPPPFAQPPQTPPPFAAGAVPGAQHQVPANNPLRGFETTARPAPPQNAPIVPPPAAPQMQAMLDAPAPPKMTVEVPLALEGFCPVVLCTEERWVAGNPAYSTMYQGHIFRFSSLEALVTFAKNPVNFTPVAMGEDIVLKVDRNRRVNGNRLFGAWFHGRVFLFSSQETFAAFEARPDYYAEIALKYEVARREQPAPIVY